VSDTPRTDALTFDVITIRGDAHLGRENYNDGWGEFVESKFARTLERELHAANERIKRLEEAGDRLMENQYNLYRVREWIKAKEAKP
jgi:hypothetical protein